MKECLASLISWNQCAFIKGRRIVDNVLLAQELVKNYHRDSERPRCALKLDIMKAFDSVNWDFVLRVLHAVYIPKVSISWIRVCLTTAAYSIKINVKSEGFFKGKKRVRQGDPLSPYLFVICMEVLTQLLNKTAAEGKIFFHPICTTIPLTHLCFADDLLIFAESSFSSLQGVKEVMYMLCLV